MLKTTINLGAIELIGIQVRTNNQNEIHPATAKIGPLVQTYFQQQLSAKITNKKNPGVTFCAYTAYQSDHLGDYTFFIGEEVSALDDLPDGLSKLSIPAQKYSKFTTEPGPMPNIVIAAWQKIWQMPSQALGGNRCFGTDFEIYDQRALDPNNTITDIYVGVK